MAKGNYFLGARRRGGFYNKQKGGRLVHAMVEEIHESEDLAVARLELLSNTAMLKKVLDKKSGSPRGVVRNDGGVPSSEVYVQHREPEHASVARRPSSSGAAEEERMRRESAFHPPPGTMSEAPHDVSPHSYEPPRYAPPAPVSASAYHFSRAHSPREHAPQMHPRPSPYPGDGSSGYYHGSHADGYYMENPRYGDPASSSAGHHMSSHHVHSSSGGRPPYLKENVPPPHYHHPSSMYSQRERHGHGHAHGHHAGSEMYPPPTPRVAVAPDYVTPPHEEHHVGVDAPPMSYSYDALAHENHHMREQLKEKDMVVSSLQERVAYLEKQISELRQLPTGKISHIPIE